MKLAQWFWRRKFFKFVNVFSQFRKYLPLEKGGALHFNKLESLTPKELCAKFGWNWPSGSGEKDFLILSMYFLRFLKYLPMEKGGPFIWTNLNPLHPMMLCAKFGWNWPSGSGQKDENVKSLRQQQRRQRRRRTTNKDLGELKRLKPVT